jgi:adenosine deaminase
MMVEDFGFGLQDLRQFMENGLDAAWLDDAQRASWRTEWNREFDQLQTRLDPR